MRAFVRKIRKTGAVLLAACVALTFCVPAWAAEPEEIPARTYTVRFFSGQRGIIDEKDGVGVEVVTVRKKAGERIERSDFFAQSRVTVTDGKYYVKGIRESGKDYKEDGSAVSVEASPSFVVDQDIDYVVSYGILGSSVAYTVNYLDGEGNELLPSETYYGNVGDQPVIAYQYIEGWLPQAYNLTRTLSEDASKNVFDFVYTSTAAGGAGAGAGAGGGGAEEGAGGGTEAAAGGAAGAGAAEAGGAAAGAGADAGAAGAGAGAGAAGAGGDVDIPDEAAPQDEGPQDLVNLDDEDTPLANLGEGIQKILNPEGDGLLIKVVRPVAGVGLAALLLGCLFFLYKRKKKKNEETGNNG